LLSANACSDLGPANCCKVERRGSPVSGGSKRVAFVGEDAWQKEKGNGSSPGGYPDGSSEPVPETQIAEDGTGQVDPTTLPKMDDSIVQQAGQSAMQEPVLQAQPGALQHHGFREATEELNVPPTGVHPEEKNTCKSQWPQSAAEPVSEATSQKRRKSSKSSSWSIRPRSSAPMRTVNRGEGTDTVTPDNGRSAILDERDSAGTTKHVKEGSRLLAPSEKVWPADDVLPAVGLRVDVRRAQKKRQVKSAAISRHGTLPSLKARPATSLPAVAKVGLQGTEVADRMVVIVHAPMEATIQDVCGPKLVHELANVPLRLAQQVKMISRRMSGISASGGRLFKNSSWAGPRISSAVTYSTNSSESDAESEADYLDGENGFNETKSQVDMFTQPLTTAEPAVSNSPPDTERVSGGIESLPPEQPTHENTSGSDIALSEGRDVCDFEWIEHAIAATSAVYRPVEEYVPELFKPRKMATSARSKRVALFVEESQMEVPQSLDDASLPVKSMNLTQRKPKSKDRSLPFLAKSKEREKLPVKSVKKGKGEKRQSMKRQVSSAPAGRGSKLVRSGSTRQPPLKKSPPSVPIVLS
ncbi:MAG: hypothetical protein BJ554DRAFT_1699, partial [Olpidium bornovanus]